MSDDQIRQSERVNELLRKAEPWSDGEIQELRALFSGFAVGGTIIREGLVMRASLELLAAIRRFDSVSADLITTTNRLTRWVLWLTGAAVLLSVVALLRGSA